MDIQAWLLRGDGTAISQIEKVNVKGNGIVFSFTPVPAKELAGVVVSVNGTLYVREDQGDVSALKEAIMFARQVLIGVMALAGRPAVPLRAPSRAGGTPSEPCWLVRRCRMRSRR